MKYIVMLMSIVMFLYINNLIIKKKSENNELLIFESYLYNCINILSYTFPLCLFLGESKVPSKKELDIEGKLKRLNLSEYFNLRTFMAVRFSFFLLSIVLYGLVVYVMKITLKEQFVIADSFIYLAILLMFSFIPDIYLKIREKKYEHFYYDEVIILQLFMILLIKSGSTVQDILYSFSKVKTFHKSTFEKGYRIAIRSTEDALDFLEMKFADISFSMSFESLKNLSDFSKEDVVRILEANLRTMEEESTNNDRKKELTKFSYSQMSVVVPFLIVVFLGAIPIIQYGISMMISSVMGM